MKEKKQHTEKETDSVKETKTEKTEQKAEQAEKTDENLEKIEKLENELKEQKDLYLRLAAEYDNYKKRTKRETERIGVDTRAEVIKSLLPALDNFMRVKAADQSSDEFKKGVELSIKSFTDALDKLGLEEIECEKAVFDPEVHYAVAQVEDENLGENTVAQVMQTGYKMGDKVIQCQTVKIRGTKYNKHSDLEEIKMAKIIGIDLGTTNSCVAVIEGGEPVVIANAEGARTTPSVVAFSKDGERMVGQVAKRQAITNPDRTISSIKRDMGTARKVNIDGKDFTPQEISAIILQKLKNDAESYLGDKVTEAVITVPAYFTDAQRQATKDAGKIAGLEVKRIINEPTAAALAYGIDKETDQKVMVYDLGGGTFDVSIIEMGDGVQEVLATAGNNRLGGDDFDKRIMDWMVETFKQQNGIDLTGDKMAMQRIKEAAEKAKIDLSGMTSTDINLPFITADANGPKHFEATLTRAKFNELTADLVEATMGPVKQALSDSGLSASNLDKVLLVGGSTRIPAVQEAIKNFTGKEPFKGINPDECVAVGAALQAGVLGGDVKGLLLLDVTPLSLGIETMGGINTKVIERNSTIPTKKSQIFSTAADGQTSVEVHVLQGEREFAKDNKTLGVFHLDGIAPAPRGIPQIEVTFDIDANGIVNVSATDKGTGKEQHITITSSTNMSKDDIDKAVKEAEQYAAEDKKRREDVDVRNNADQMVYQCEKTITDMGDKLDESEKSAVQAKIDETKEALKGDDIEKIKTASEALQQEIYKISEKVYKAAQEAAAAQQGANPADGATGAQGSDSNVYEADYKDADDDKKN